MKKDVKLYNVLFPVWMLTILPHTWLVVVPANFIIDSLVLVITMKVLKMDNPKDFYKKHILPVFGLGFLADILASIPMWFGLVFLELGGTKADGLDLTLPGLLVAAVLIFAFNYFFSFSQCDKKLRLKLALTYAIATAPYTFLIPADWIY